MSEWPELFDMRSMLEDYAAMQDRLTALEEKVAALEAASAQQKYEMTVPVGAWRPRNHRYFG